MISVQNVWDDPSILDGKYLKFSYYSDGDYRYFSPTKFKEDDFVKDRYSRNPDFFPICAGTTNFKVIYGKALEISVNSARVALYSTSCARIYLSIYPDDRGLIWDLKSVEEITKEEFDSILNKTISSIISTRYHSNEINLFDAIDNRDLLNNKYLSVEYIGLPYSDKKFLSSRCLIPPTTFTKCRNYGYSGFEFISDDENLTILRQHGKSGILDWKDLDISIVNNHLYSSIFCYLNYGSCGKIIVTEITKEEYEFNLNRASNDQRTT